MSQQFNPDLSGNANDFKPRPPVPARKKLGGSAIGARRASAQEDNSPQISSGTTAMPRGRGRGNARCMAGAGNTRNLARSTSSIELTNGRGTPRSARARIPNPMSKPPTSPRSQSQIKDLPSHRSTGTLINTSARPPPPKKGSSIMRLVKRPSKGTIDTKNPIGAVS